jgi:hypothetical protein
MRLAAIFALLAARAWACSCMVLPTGNPPCQSAWQSDAVFTGMVLQISERSAGPLRRTVRFRIAEAFIGLDPKQQEIVIDTGSGGGDCGYSFTRGRDYIVYAYRDQNGALSTGICSPTRPLENAAGDLAYFHRLPQAPPTAEVRVTTIAGASLTLTGPGVRQQAVADASGRHVFAGLPPGEYRVERALEGYAALDQVRPVQVHAKGCAEVLAPLQIDRMVTGSVFHKDGRPASGITVEALSPKRPDYPADSAATDAQGRYELRRLPAGDYQVGVSLAAPATLKQPYARTLAGMVQVTDTPGVTRLDFTLPEPQHERLIHGIVVWPDGRPVEGARVTLQDARWTNPVLGADAGSGRDGRFTLRGLDGTRYLVRALTYGRAPMYTEAVAVEPGRDPLDLKLILTGAGRPAPGPALPK